MAEQQGDIKKISISVTAQTYKAQRSITALTTRINNLKHSLSRGFKAKQITGIEGLTETVKKLRSVPFGDVAKGVDSLTAALQRLNEVTINPAITSQLAELAKNKTAVEKAIKETTAASTTKKSATEAAPTGTAVSGEEKLHSFASAEDVVATKSYTLTGALNALASAFNATENSGETFATKSYTIVGALSHVAKYLNKLAPILKKAAAAMAKFVGNMMLAPFKKIGSSIAGLTKKFLGFFSALKRIAFYRAIRFVLKEITQAFREGIENLYQYSKLINGQFAKSMDTLATSALYAKNSLAAMVAPIVNQVAPAIDMLVDKIVEGMNKVNELIASFTGASTWTAALKYPKEYAESLDDAAGSAKKLRATLLGFDEINRLDDNNKGSRGKAGEELDYSKMFEERAVSSQANGLVQSLKDAFSSNNWTELGTILGEAIKQGLDSINWESIKKRFNHHAEMVGSLINGLISVDGLGTSLGATIAEVFNVAVGKLNTFFHTVEWNKLGTFVGDGFNSIVDTFDIVTLGDTFATIINSAVGTLNGFINTVDWDKFGKFLSDGINKFFNTVNTRQIASTIYDGIAKALKAVTSFFKNTDFEQIGTKVGQFIKGIKWKDIFFNAIKLIGAALTAPAKYFWGLIKELFGGVGEWFSNAFTSAVNGIKKAFSAVGSFFTGVWKSITSAFSSAGKWFGDTFTTAKKNVTNAFSSVGTFFSDKWTGIKNTFSNVGSWFKDKFTAAWKSVKDVFGSVKTFFTDRWSDIKNVFSNTATWFGDKFSAAWKMIKQAFSGVGLFFDDLWSTIKKKFTDIGQKIGNAVGKAFAEAINAVLTAVEKVINAPIKAINALLKTVNKLPGVDIGKLDTITLKKLDVSQYAGGGTPSTGSVFIAGERGAELVASNGGHTQVANRDQIANSVAIGMEAANEDTLAELRKQNELLRIIASKDFSPVTTISTDTITNALNRQNRRVGATVIPVGG